MCPVGCTLKVEKKDGKVVVTGNACPRGAIYGEKEVTAPERSVSTVKIYKTGTICLKTDKPVPKGKIDEVLRAVAEAKEPKKIGVGETLIKNVAGTNCDVVVTEVNI